MVCLKFLEVFNEEKIVVGLENVQKKHNSSIRV